jgi:hypothetical protein
VGDEILKVVSRFIEKEKGAALRRVPKLSMWRGVLIAIRGKCFQAQRAPSIA